MFACTVLGISCVQFDDTRIVSGSSDKTIKVSTYMSRSVYHFKVTIQQVKVSILFQGQVLCKGQSIISMFVQQIKLSAPRQHFKVNVKANVSCQGQYCSITDNMYKSILFAFV